MGGPAESGTATADVPPGRRGPTPDDGGRLRACCTAASSATDRQRHPHNLVVTGASASTFWIDGFYVVP